MKYSAKFRKEEKREREKLHSPNSKEERLEHKKDGLGSKKHKVISHLKGDIKTFYKEASEDRELIKHLKHGSVEHHKKNAAHHSKMAKHHAKLADHHHKLASSSHHSKHLSKVETVMHEFKEGGLHSGSKKGPKVTNRKQAVAIALSEARKHGEKVGSASSASKNAGVHKPAKKVTRPEALDRGLYNSKKVGGHSKSKRPRLHHASII